MQRIKKVKWPVKNIGGDRAYCKLRYVIGQDFGIAQGNAFNSQNLKYNTGVWPSSVVPANTSIASVFGQTPNLSTMGALYTRYRIRGIKLKLTYWQQSGPPIVLYTNAQSDQASLHPPFNTSAPTAPLPNFITPNISILPEQRWARYRVCSQTQNGGKPTVLKSYYSVNKVFGPDQVTKNDADFVGGMKPTTPYWDDINDFNTATPKLGPWCQFGIFTMNGTNAATAVTGVMKVEATVYTEFFGKRVQTQ